jgi:mono/diheme cytochrome c family protein
MSSHQPDSSSPRRLTDPEIVQVHDQLAHDRTDDGGNYKLMPLFILGVFSALIFFGGTYLGFYVGNFAPTVHDERGSPNAAVAEVKIDIVALGKRQYTTSCVNCHQATGLGTPGLYPPLAKSEWVTGSEDRLVRVLLHGLMGPITVAGQQFPGTAQMPGFGPGGTVPLSDDSIAAVLTYVRQEWGNSAPPVTAAKVTEIRTQVGARGPWTAAELPAQ